jgi:uncharacterized protein YjiS (DUF1127 family)
MSLSIAPPALPVLVQAPGLPATLPMRAGRMRVHGGVEPLGVFCARTIRLIDHAGRRRPADALADHLQAVWRRLLIWQARRATRALLHALDDRTLDDIGLRRSEINAAVCHIERRLRRRA